MKADLAIVIGGAECWKSDLDNLLEIIPNNMPFDIAVVNDHLSSFDEYPISFGFSLHSEKIDQWLSARTKPTDAKIVTMQNGKVTPKAEIFEYVPPFKDKDRNVGSGSSGFYAIHTLLKRYGYKKVVACGIPMTSEKNYFRDVEWKEVRGYYGAWKHPDNKALLSSRFRSMSGWTKGRFGAPDLEWLMKG